MSDKEWIEALTNEVHYLRRQLDRAQEANRELLNVISKMYGNGRK